jgi:hypothetical protein
MAPPDEKGREGLLLVPITRLYDPVATVIHSRVLQPRMAPLELWLNAGDAKRLKIGDDAQVEIRVNGSVGHIKAVLEDTVPEGVALMGRNREIAAQVPISIEVKPVG